MIIINGCVNRPTPTAETIIIPSCDYFGEMYLARFYDDYIIYGEHPEEIKNEHWDLRIRHSFYNENVTSCELRYEHPH